MVNKELILITGNQNRHLSVSAEIIDNYKVTWVRYNRRIVPQATEKSSEFLNMHLEHLIADEKAAIGNYKMKDLEKKSNINQIIDVSWVDEFNQKCKGVYYESINNLETLRKKYKLKKC